jgi:hypothetical protein
MKHTLLLKLTSILLFFVWACKNQDSPEPVLLPPSPSNATIETINLDKFPSNSLLSFSRLESLNPAVGSSHDEVSLRILNSGIDTLTISDLKLSDNISWKISTEGKVYNPSTKIILKPNAFVDVLLKFVADDDQGKVSGRVVILKEKLTIFSDADNAREKVINLYGLWQDNAEGSKEPYTQEIIEVFGLKTQTGFTNRNTTHSEPLADEVYASYFLRADNTKPIYIRQLSAHHSCCTATEAIYWQAKGSGNPRNQALRHDKVDGQTILPRKINTLAIGEATFNTNKAFSISISDDSTDPNRNAYKDFDYKGNPFRGVRVWKARDFEGNIIPNAYIFSHDYLSAEANFDYNDNVYYISNIKPE